MRRRVLVRCLSSVRCNECRSGERGCRTGVAGRHRRDRLSPDPHASTWSRTQFGIPVADPYRWLENDVRTDPEVEGLGRCRECR